MSRAFKNRRKAIRDERRRLGVKTLSRDQFYELSSKWRAALDGPILGTLADFFPQSSEVSK